jgi:putative alpha-1,2-mannosidase
VRQPSPWIGDYCAWTILPVLGDPQERADDRCSWFGHKSETIRPHYYSVFLPDYDLTAEIVPTVRAALLRVTLGEAGRPGFVVNPCPGGKVSLSDDGRSVCGRSVQTTNRRCQPAGMKNDFVVSLDRAASESRVLPDGALYVGFPEAAKGTRLTVGIASSFISPEQAALNLRELGDRDFKRLEREGRDAWNEVLGKVREQAGRMTQDSEEMVNLNRTLTGINTIYEMQLKSVSQQVGTIDQINDQTRKMAKQIEELNAVYARMIEALTVNMPKGVAPQA